MSGYFDKNFGNWLPDDCEEIKVCECPNCDRDLNVGDDVVEYDGEFYCDTDCLLECLSITRVTLDKEDM